MTIKLQNTQVDDTAQSLPPDTQEAVSLLTHMTLSMPSSPGYPWVVLVSPVPPTLLAFSQVLQAGAAVQKQPILSSHILPSCQTLWPISL